MYIATPTKEDFEIAMSRLLRGNRWTAYQRADRADASIMRNYSATTAEDPQLSKDLHRTFSGAYDV